MKRFVRSAVVLCAIAAACLRADVKLPAVISDNMALQQGQPVPIWGWADPGEEVSVTFAGQTKTAKAGDDKKWIVKLDALKTADPSELTVKGKNTIVVKNVIVGEVWLCSGQSMHSWLRSSRSPERHTSGRESSFILLLAFSLPG